MMIEINGLSKTYKTRRRTKRALNDVSISLPDLGLIGLAGESGSGKTTLLRILSGEVTEYEGDVFLGGKNLRTKGATRANDVGYLEQNEELIPYLTVNENLEYFGRAENVGERLRDYGLDSSVLSKYPDEISGGERQRLAILRHSLENKRIILLDEPTSSLDRKNAESVMEFAKSISAGCLVIVVCHDEELLSRHCDRIVTLEEGSVVDDVNLGQRISSEPTGKKHGFARRSGASLFGQASFGFLKRHRGTFFGLAFIQTLLAASFALLSSFLNYNGIDDIVSNMRKDEYCYVYECQGIPIRGNDYAYGELKKTLGEDCVMKSKDLTITDRESKAYTVSCIVDPSLKGGDIILGRESGFSGYAAGDTITAFFSDGTDAYSERTVKGISDGGHIRISEESVLGPKCLSVRAYTDQGISFFSIYDAQSSGMQPGVLVSAVSKEDVGFCRNPENGDKFADGVVLDMVSFLGEGYKVSGRHPDHEFKEGALFVDSDQFEKIARNSIRYDSLIVKAANKRKVARFYSSNHLYFSDVLTVKLHNDSASGSECDKLNVFLSTGYQGEGLRYISWILAGAFSFLQLLLASYESNRASSLRKIERNFLRREGGSRAFRFFSASSYQYLSNAAVFGLPTLAILLFWRGISRALFPGSAVSFISFDNMFLIQMLALFAMAILFSSLVTFVEVRRND